MVQSCRLLQTVGTYLSCSILIHCRQPLKNRSKYAINKLTYIAPSMLDDVQVIYFLTFLHFHLIIIPTLLNSKQNWEHYNSIFLLFQVLRHTINSNSNSIPSCFDFYLSKCEKNNILLFKKKRFIKYISAEETEEKENIVHWPYRVLTFDIDLVFPCARMGEEVDLNGELTKRLVATWLICNHHVVEKNINELKRVMYQYLFFLPQLLKTCIRY